MEITSKDKRLYQLARKVSLLSDCRYLHGTVLARGNRVLSLACNKKISHPIQQKYRKHVCSIHAEMRAMILCQAPIIGATCYNARICQGNLDGISKPCATCQQLLQDAGIVAIVYHDGFRLTKAKL